MFLVIFLTAFADIVTQTLMTEMSASQGFVFGAFGDFGFVLIRVKQPSLWLCAIDEVWVMILFLH